jgi:hypothetical protein
MTQIFQCQQCLKTFVPGPSYEKVYEGQTLCMMCRKANGQQEFTPDENICLFTEENLAKGEFALSKKKIIYIILKEIEKGGQEPKFPGINLNKDEFGDLIDSIQDAGLIKGASVVRGGQGNHVQIVLLNTTKITLQGLDYLEKNSNLAY